MRPACRQPVPHRRIAAANLNPAQIPLRFATEFRMSSPSRITQQKLDLLLADIHAHIQGNDWSSALRQLSSIKDYAMGEEHLCSANAALENCEQLRGYFPSSAPERVFKNIDSIAREIQHLKKQDVPDVLGLVLHPFVLAAIGVILVYWFFLR